MEWSREIFDSPVLDNWWQTGRCNYLSVEGNDIIFKNLNHLL